MRCENCEDSMFGPCQNCLKAQRRSSAEAGYLTVDEIIDKLRGQLQNCISHLERAKNRSHGKSREAYRAAIASANKTLYETQDR